MLFLDEELVYVGRSRDCPARIAAHRANGRAFDRHLIAPCDDVSSEWIEKAQVRATEAVQNRVVFLKKPRSKTPPLEPPIPEHPMMILNKSQAKARARRFGLSDQFDAAVRCGELVFRPKNPEHTHATRESLITVGELFAWCEAKLHLTRQPTL